MANPPASKTKGAASKPQLASSTTSRSTSRSGAGADGPYISPQSPGDSISPLSAPKSIRDAKTLCRMGYVSSETEASTAAICNGLLTSLAVHPEVTPAVCALITSVGLMLPEAFGVLYASTKELSIISEKIDKLLLHADELPRTPPQGLANREEKLDLVLQGIQKATETWQTVPTRSQARTPPPANSKPGLPTIPAGPTRAEAAKDRRLKSQGCFILVEPTSPAIKESLDKLDARMLVKKAEFAWDTAWDVVKGTHIVKDLKLTEKPRVSFKTALRLARGGIRYELGNRTQAALLSDARLASEFEKGFGGATCRGQGATILLQCAPVDFNPEDLAAIPCFESENALSNGDVLSMTWCKPPHKREPEQTMAVLKLEMRSHDLADRLITVGGQLDCLRVLFRKARQEPMRCLRCQKIWT
ncbi:hypothetical protein RSOL_110130 [Rhizoctonia solani AG-3 Rhs1AP]|uniref:Uncharacterized protein n=1 Tax=Rhizoctonia solani AG-3 Rhs1AP TaxID=1086054 RepID=X8J086_9AGAM|nr:hypothetical protein RSOL_110130 [Rhizoctonia solani AG-3 Rhs1AP]